MTENTNRFLKTSDGLRLFVQFLGGEDAERTLVLVHGYGEHGGRYLQRAELFVEAGYRVVIPDVRGHGQSDGERGHVMRFDQYLADLDLVMGEVRTDAASTFLFGHSHGGLIAATRLLSGEAAFARAVLSSPLLGLSIVPPAWKEVAGRVLSRLLPRLSLPTEVESKWVSHDPDVVAAYDADPLNHHVVNSRWYTEVLGAMERALLDARRLTVPTLVLQAGDDKLVSASASRRWAAAGPADLLTYEEVEGAYHELFFEPDGERHARRVLEWFAQT